jgi:hypothetical protein
MLTIAEQAIVLYEKTIEEWTSIKGGNFQVDDPCRCSSVLCALCEHTVLTIRPRSRRSPRC